MSKIFDAVNVRRAGRSDSLFSTIPKNTAVFDALPAQQSLLLGETHLPPMPAVAKNTPTSHRMSIVHVVWAFSVTSIVAPFVIGFAQATQEESANFPYACNFFFMSLVIGLPAASVHLFCCSLCLFSRNRMALVLSIASIFLQILCIEYTCGVNRQGKFTYYLLFACIFTGTASQTLVLENMQETKSKSRSSGVVFFFSSILVVSTIFFVTALVSDIFKLKLQPKKQMYLQSLPAVMAFVAYVCSTVTTLRPIFRVVEVLNSAGL